MAEETKDHRFKFWLSQNKLASDPFESFEAGKERAFLSQVFVDRPYFHEILGDPKYPRPAFLLAGRGDGKTATREMIVYECNHAPASRKALPVRYFDISRLLEQAGNDPTRITLRMHVAQIVREILKTLTDQELVPSRTFDPQNLDDPDRSLLAEYVSQFADPRTQPALDKILATTSHTLNWANFSPFETLQLLAELVTRLQPPDKKPFQAIYILIDRVDESSAGPGAVLDILRPLVSDGPVLETPGVGFKFFLPSALEDQLRQALPIRLDRVAFQRVTWEQSALEKMVENRLNFFSEGYVPSLGDLCKENAKHKVMDRLIDHCDNSPRVLLQLCHNLLQNHVQSINYDNQIDNQAVTKTINDFVHDRETEHIRTIEAAAAQPAQSSTPPPRGLFMEESGHVWIDGEQLSTPLTEKEFSLLRILYYENGKIVSQDTLIEAIWKSEALDQDSQNLRKLVARLRERLEPCSENRESRFIKSAKGRGYWLEQN